MKYLILSPTGLSLFMVPRLGKSSEVKKIYFCILDSEMDFIGKDLNRLPDWEKLEMVKDYNKIINENKPDELIIVIDDVGIGETGKHLSDAGYRVIGGKPITDRIEDDRQFATELMKRVMKVPESVSFTDWSRALEFVKNNEPDERLIFKPNDSSVPKEYTYVARDISDMVDALHKFKSEWKWKEDFQIQRFIKGTEVDFSAFFNGQEYLDNSLIIYFENKPIMSGDIGPATGGSIAVEFAYKSKGIFWDILQKLKPVLIKGNYKGQLSVNCIVSEVDKQPYFLEFCGRFGYPSFPLDISLIEDNGHTLHELFTALVNETNPKLFPLDKIACTVSVFVPPAPDADQNARNKGEPIAWSHKWDQYFFPYYIYYDKKMVLTGNSSWVLQVTCVDSTLDGAVSVLYDTYMPTLELKNKMYRNDLGTSAKQRIKKLKELGLV